jgi:hypothetical protein
MKSLFFLISLFVSIQSFAQEANIGFESGNLTNWQAGGGIGTKSANGWSDNGVGVAVVTGVSNFSPGGGKTWNVTPYGSHMASIQPGGSSVQFDSMGTSLGLTSSSISGIKSMLAFQAQNGGGGNPNPTNASWMKRDVQLVAGTTYRMAWQYISTDYTPFNDGSIMTLVHKTNSSILGNLNNTNSQYALLGFTNPGTGNYSTGSYGATGWQVATFTVPQDGTYVLGFASFNLGDTALSPILLVDEVQGTTALNGTTFQPVSPNPGSTAPPPPPPPAPEPTYNSNITPQQQTRVTNWLNRGNNSSGVYIDQIGNNNIIDVIQQGNKNNYADIDVFGSTNKLDINQVTTTNVGSGQYLELAITGNLNEVNITQQNNSGKTSFNVINGNNNMLDVAQKDSGNHYLDVKLTGNNHNVTALQQGSAQHKATISVTNAGGAVTVNTTQTGSTPQVYSLDQTCTNPAGCSVTIVQGQ